MQFYSVILLDSIFSNFLTKWYYYLAFFILLIAIVLFLILKKPNIENNLSRTQKICYIAVFSALATVANIFDIKVSDDLQLSLVATVGFLAGYLLGGLGGFSSCIIGDLLGAIINPHGAYNPIIAFGTGLWGFIPGVIFFYFVGNKYIKAVISFLICSVLISGLINTLGIYLMYGLGKKTFLAYFILYPYKLIVVVINAIISISLMVLLNKVLPKDKFAVLRS